MTAVLTLINLSIEFDLINDLGKKRFIVDIYLGKTGISDLKQAYVRIIVKKSPCKAKTNPQQGSTSRTGRQGSEAVD